MQQLLYTGVAIFNLLQMESAYGSSLAPTIGEITGITVIQTDKTEGAKKVGISLLSTSLLSKRCFYLSRT